MISLNDICNLILSHQDHRTKCFVSIGSCYSSNYMYFVIIESKKEGRLEFIFDRNVYINQVNYTTLCAKCTFRWYLMKLSWHFFVYEENCLRDSTFRIICLLENIFLAKLVHAVQKMTGQNRSATFLIS